MALVSNATSHYTCLEVLHQRHERPACCDMTYLGKCVLRRDKFFNAEDGLRNLSCLSWSSEKKHVTSFCSYTGHRRLGSTIIAASPPTEDVAVAAEPLIKEDLISYLSSGCKPKENWRIGTEHEKFGFEIETLRPMRYEQIADLLDGIAERFDWEKVMEGDKIIGLKQVNLDFSSEQDMIRKFRAGLALQPIATAIFANSPFKEGKPNGYLSMRSHVWSDTDNDRTGMLPFVFDDSFGFEKYVDYALEVPMYFVYRNKKYIDCSGMSFRDFMKGKLPPIPGELPTLTDWENHLTTIFPEVRLKRYLEMRGADGGPWRRLCALPAFWVGLLYDEISLQKVLDLTRDWTAEERQMLRSKVPRAGLQTAFRDTLVKHIAEDVVKMARDGLERRGYKETGFLNEVAEVVRTGTTPAEKLLELYHEKWEENVDPLFEELLY
ncbi:unnamed protein product [Victoria cruziana]